MTTIPEVRRLRFGDTEIQCAVAQCGDPHPAKKDPCHPIGLWRYLATQQSLGGGWVHIFKHDCSVKKWKAERFIKASEGWEPPEGET